MSAIEIGRLLRANITSCVVGCRVSQINVPSFGGMVSIPLDEERSLHVYGLIYDIHIEDDGLLRQLVTSNNVDEKIIQDNRVNRNVPVEISVLYCGHRRGREIYHLLPPRPPLTLDILYSCSEEELCQFVSSGQFGYFRHILRSIDIPVAELLAAHVQQAAQIQRAAGNAGWVGAATRELILLLRDDYPTLMSVLGALADVQD